MLLALLLGGLVLIAGCSAIQGDDQAESRILLVNQDAAEHAVVVEITNESGLVYSEGRTVAGESDLDLESFAGTGEYDVTVTVDGTSSQMVHTFEDGDRVTNIGIDNEGTVTIE